MKLRSVIALSLVLTSLSVLALGLTPPVFAESGPKTGKLQINIYNDPTTESWALDAGTIDINDWPVSKDFIDMWSPAGSKVALASFAELGKMEFDIYNWRWPTGVTHAFDNCLDCQRAWAFRRALAYLTNKPKYITDYLKGYGYIMETEVPYPAGAGWTDYGSLENATANAHTLLGVQVATGYIYRYNPTKAAAYLDAAGFTMLPSGLRQDPKTPGTALAPLTFYIRIDDPNRRQAGEDLAAEMTALGLQVNKIITERSVCFYNVMVLHNYHIYTGGWSLGSDPDYIFDLYHSSMSGYAYDQNYAWFRNAEFDYWAAKVKYAPDPDSLYFACIQAQWVKAKYIPVIELWASKGVKAYRKGWPGVVNMEGYGTDNSWSFLRMDYATYAASGNMPVGHPADTIIYGFKSDISAIHVISSEWLWDWNVLGLIYEGMLGGEPYNLATDWNTSLAEAFSVGSWAGGTKITFTLRNNAYFHDGSLVTADDVKFSLLFNQAAGSGVSWNYPLVMDIDHVTTSGNTIEVFFNKISVFALHWAGGLPIINKDLWLAADSGSLAWGLSMTPADGPWTMANRMNVRYYHPWTDDRDGVGGVDIKQDGTGPWSFVSYSVGSTVLLEKHPYPYYLTQAFVDKFINERFHMAGNVNFPTGYGDTQSPKWYGGAIDSKVDLTDLTYIGRASGTTAGMLPWGDTWGKFNPDADLEQRVIEVSGVPTPQKDKINVFDLFVAGKSFGKTAG